VKLSSENFKGFYARSHPHEVGEPYSPREIFLPAAKDLSHGEINSTKKKCIPESGKFKAL